ncbi:MAG: hypothetical protein ACKVP7_29280 [Hyphomicrobiaceae bacterium]
MNRSLILFVLLTVALIAFRLVGSLPRSDNGVISAWLAIPKGSNVVSANYDRPDFDFAAGRGNVRLRSSWSAAELEQFFQAWLEREGFVAIDGMHRVIVTETMVKAFAMYACHRSEGRFVNIVGSEDTASATSQSGVTLVYWETKDLALVQDLFGLKAGERPCDN